MSQTVQISSSNWFVINECKFLEIWSFSVQLSADEEIVRYYGRHYFNRGKPVRFGFEQQAFCCSETGNCYHMDMYEGRNPDEGRTNKLDESKVLKMVSVLEHPTDHEIYFDNFFTTLDLLVHVCVYVPHTLSNAWINFNQIWYIYSLNL